MTKQVSIKNGNYIRTGKNGVQHGPRVRDVIGKETGLKLQPSFVEWMMGYPPNWTDLNYRKRRTAKRGSKVSATRLSRKSRPKY